MGERTDYRFFGFRGIRYRRSGFSLFFFIVLDKVDLVTGNIGLGLVFIDPQTADVIVRRFHVRHRDDHDRGADARLDRADLHAFFVEQKSGGIDRQMDMHGRRVFLHGLFLDHAQD